MEGAEMDAGASLPPPPPVPEGAVPAIAPGFGTGDGSGPAGNNGGGNGVGRNGGKNGGSGSAALAALALVPAVPIPQKTTRPAFGKAGRPTQLCVNHFKAALTKSEDVYHYNVSLSLVQGVLGLRVVLCLMSCCRAPLYNV